MGSTVILLGALVPFAPPSPVSTPACRKLVKLISPLPPTFLLVLAPQGSLWVQKENAYRLRTWVIDYDNNSAVSRAVITAIDASNAGGFPHLGWTVVSGPQYDSVEKIRELLVDEKAWAAVTSELLLGFLCPRELENGRALTFLALAHDSQRRSRGCSADGEADWRCVI